MSTQIVTLQYNNLPVIFQSDAFINATTIAKQFGKRPNDWLSLESTKEYIKVLHAALFPEIALPENMVVKENQLVKVQNGGTIENKGTWLHPKLAVNFARWLDVRFAVWCDMQIDKLLKTVPNALRDLPRPNITGMEAAQLKRSVEAACKTNKKLYSELYRKLYAAYGIKGYADLPAGKLNEALVFLGLKPVEMPEMVLIDAKELAELKRKPTSAWSNHATMILSSKGDADAIYLVRFKEGSTIITEQPENVMIGTPEKIIRDLIDLGFVVIKKQELIARLEA